MKLKSWDNIIEEDIKAGKLDKFANEAIKDFEANRCSDLGKHFASPKFWECYNKLPENIRELADKKYKL